MEIKNLWIFVVVILLTIVVSFVTVQLTGNVVKVQPSSNYTESIYTQAEVDSKINIILNQIGNLSSQVSWIDRKTTDQIADLYQQINQMRFPVTIMVTSVPTGATVYVDNINKGATPVNVTTLSSGNHLIKISKSGYRDYMVNSTFVAGHSSLNVPLVKA